MKIFLLKNGLIEVDNIDPINYIKWKVNFVKNNEPDSWLDKPTPILWEEEYIDFINYTQNALIDELLK